MRPIVASFTVTTLLFVLAESVLSPALWAQEMPPPPMPTASPSSPPTESPLPTLAGSPTPSGSAQTWLNNNQAGATCVGDTLATDSALTAGKALCSPDGKWVAVYQASDGNFVVYNTQTSTAAWSLLSMGVNSTALLPTGNLYIQNDCNLVAYAGAQMAAIWNSNTSRWGNACQLKMQNDGNLVVYARRNLVPGGVALWSIQTPGYAITQRTVSFGVPNGRGLLDITCTPDRAPNGNLNGFYTMTVKGYYNCIQFLAPPAGFPRGYVRIFLHDDNGPLTDTDTNFDDPTGSWDVEFTALLGGTYDVGGHLNCGNTTLADGVKIICAVPVLQ